MPGKYWKALPREEKEVWEAKAIVAQAEHRKKYPDWRFRPGANALAKVKDGPRKRTNRKGRGEAEKEERSREKRCAKIADLLVAGKTGADLEVAIEEYDCAHGGTQAIKKEGSGLLVVQFAENVTPATEPAQSQAQATIPAHASPAIQATPVDKAPRKQSRSLSPEAAHDSRFKMPLTAMFKRSSSAPAPSTRAGEDAGDLTVVPSGHQDVTLVGSTSPSEAFAAPHPVNAHEGKPPVESDITGVPDANTRLLDVKQHAPVQPLPDSHSAVANFSSSGANVAQSLWTQVSKALMNVAPRFSQADDIFTVIQTYTATYHDIDTYSPSVQSFDSDLEDNASPAQSPLAYTFDIAGDGESANFVAYSPTTCVPSFGAGSMMYGNSPSSYSSLKGWADDTTVKNTTYNHGSVPAFLPGTQYPMVYDPDRVMKDAFAAASTAPYEDWGVAFTTSESYRFSSARDIQSLQLYAQGWQDIARRQDDRQLF